LNLGPQDVPYVYCLFYVTFVPLRWIYYRYKKWHYYLLVSGIWNWNLLFRMNFCSKVFIIDCLKCKISVSLLPLQATICLKLAEAILFDILFVVIGLACVLYEAVYKWTSKAIYFSFNTGIFIRKLKSPRKIHSQVSPFTFSSPPMFLLCFPRYHLNAIETAETFIWYVIFWACMSSIWPYINAQGTLSMPSSLLLIFPCIFTWMYINTVCMLTTTSLWI